MRFQPIWMVIPLILFAGIALFIFSPAPSPIQTASCLSADRSAYSYIPPAVFSNLPPSPACIRSLSDAFARNQIEDEFFLTSEYYLQPEFYPSFFTEGIPQWSSPVPSYYGAVGFGAFPISRTLNLTPNQPRTIRVFFHSGYGVRSTQGARLTYQILHGTSQDVLVSLDENASTGFLLGPTFPKFSSSWVYPVDITLTLSRPLVTPITLTFHTAPPSPEISSYGKSSSSRYFDITEYIGSRQAFQVVLAPSS